MEKDLWAGGCQCGAVRYAFSVKPENPSICHCRMCQKQFGNLFGVFASSLKDNFRITRGSIARFQSSEEGFRGFCRDCGTPLTFEYTSSPRIWVATGSLDRHSEMKPTAQHGRESMEPWFAEVMALPCTPTGDGTSSDNRQHPDHDTDHWP